MSALAVPEFTSQVPAWLGAAAPPPRKSERSDPRYWRAMYLRAKFDAAQTNEDNRRHWSNADNLSAAAANDPATRQTLRARSRYEAANNGYFAGIIRTLANDLVGTGPTLQVLTDDDAFNEAVETAWANWCRAAALAETLHVLSQAKTRDGESFAKLTTDPELGDPVKLAVYPVEADRVADPWGGVVPELPPDFSYMDGVMYGPNGRPVSYVVLKRHPGDAALWRSAGMPAYLPGDYETVDARFMLHWLRRERPGQLRGVPDLTASLPLGAQLRRWTLAALMSAEIAAEFSALLTTPAPADGETDDPVPFESLEIERGMMTTLPAGCDLKQLESKQPPQTYDVFKRELLKEIARPVHMPLNVAGGDSSLYNFSSAKLDHINYRAALRVDRSFAERTVLEKIFAAWAAEASLIPGLLPADFDVAVTPRVWFWPGWASMDKAEAKMDTEQLNNGTTTLAEVLGEWGIDWRKNIRQRGKELELMAQEGVPPPPSGKGGQGGDGGGFGAAADGGFAELDTWGGRLGGYGGHVNGHANGHAKKYATVGAAFCPTGPGGGVDPSCPSGPGGGGGGNGGGDSAGSAPSVAKGTSGAAAGRLEVTNLAEVARSNAGGAKVLAGAEAEEFAKEVGLDKKSPEAAKAVAAFQGSSALNMYNRDPGKFGERPDLDAINATIDKAIGDAPALPVAVSVFRGVDGAPGLVGLKVGDEFADGAHLSTSLDRDYVQGFHGVDKADNVVMQVRVPAGTHALYAGVHPDYAHERELILPRGGRYKVAAVHPMGRGKYLVVDVLPKGGG